MAATFVVLPQWQGSASARALQLRDGAEAISRDLPSRATVFVNVPLDAGTAEDTRVQRLSALRTIRDQARAALAEVNGPAITIGGDAGSELASIEHAIGRSGGSTTVVWFSAHPNLHTPQSSPSGAFQTMVLKTLLGAGAEELVPGQVLTPDKLVLVGVRAMSDSEASYLHAAGIPQLSAQPLDAEALITAVESAHPESVYLHIDLNVLDPGEFDGLSDPEPFGIALADLISSITALRRRFPLAGAGIVEFAPSTPESAANDMPSVLRIIAALTSREAT